MYSAIDCCAYSFARAFREEAERLWAAEKSQNARDSLTTAAAAQILSLASLCQGRNEMGLELLTEGLRILERLKFLGANGNDPINEDHDKASSDERTAQVRSVWGIFVWSM